MKTRRILLIALTIILTVALAVCVFVACRQGKKPSIPSETPSGDDSGTDNSPDKDVEEDLSGMCVVTYDLCGGTLNYGINTTDNYQIAYKPNSVLIDISSYRQNKLYKRGYQFVGWSKSKFSLQQWNFETDCVTADITLYAKWKAVEYTITYHLNNEEWLNEPAIQNDNVVTYTIEQSVVFNNPTHPHYTFMGWYKEPTFDNQVTELPVGRCGDVDLYAKWWYGTEGLMYSEQGNDCQVVGYNGMSESVAIPNVWSGRNVTSIGNNAFENCTLLQEITIPASVISIGSSAFFGCNSLQKVYYGGSQTQWENIEIGDYNYSLTDATRYYYSAEKPDGSELPVDRYWRRVDGKPMVWKEED